MLQPLLDAGEGLGQVSRRVSKTAVPHTRPQTPLPKGPMCICSMRLCLIVCVVCMCV